MATPVIAHRLNLKWLLPSHFDENPLIWIGEESGLLVDLRDTPRGVQEVAFGLSLN